MAELQSDDTAQNGANVDIFDVNSPFSAKERISRIVEIKRVVETSDISDQTSKQIIQLLLYLYPRYIDKQSQQSVVACLASLLKADKNGTHLNLALKALSRDASRPGWSPRVAIIILELLTAISVPLASSTELWELHGKKFIEAQVAALSNCLAGPDRTRLKSRAFRQVNQALRNLFLGSLPDSSARECIRFLTSPSSGPKNAVVLGILTSVLSLRPELKTLVVEETESYISFFSREIAGSKTPLPSYIPDALRPFFSLLSLSDVEAKIVPLFEKGLLRAPEVILSGVMASVVSSLDKDYDLAPVFKSRLLKPLLSATKSSSAELRENAVTALSLLLSRSKDTANTLEIIKELTTPMKQSKVPSFEQRVAYSGAIAACTPSASLSLPVVLDMSAIAAKETNEAALKSELDALVLHAVSVLQSGDSLPSECVSTISKGCQDKKSTVSKLWVFAVGDIFLKLEPAHIEAAGTTAFLSSVLTALLPQWKDLTSAQSLSVQSGTFSLMYVLTVLLLSPAILQSENTGIKGLVSQFDLSAQFKKSDPTTSFLLNPRLFTNLTREDDIQWFITALDSASSTLMAQERSATWKEMWCQAVFFFICSKSQSPKRRKQTVELLRAVYLRHPSEVGAAVIGALWNWLQQLSAHGKDSLAVIAGAQGKDILPIIGSIFQPEAPASVLTEQLVRAIVLCQPSLIEGSSWIQFCLKSGQDPNQVAAQHADRLMAEILSTESTRPMAVAASLRKAMATAASDLAFVAPDIIFPLWLTQVQIDLSIDGLPTIGMTEIGIYLAPEGEPFVNVLDGSTSIKLPDKKTNRDYDTLQWEQEVRAQLAQKRGDTRKLTPDERAKVNEQIRVESELRSTIRQVEQKLLRGVSFVQALLDSPLVEFDRWATEVIGHLLGVVKYDKANLLGSQAIDTYLNCSASVTERLETIRRSIGSAILRSTDVNVPLDGQEEKLGELVTRVLYRLRISSEQYPLDPISLAYTLPLCSQVLKIGGIDYSSNDERDEQIILALEFLSFHVQQAADVRLPRARILTTLLESLSAFPTHFKLAKDCLFGFVRAISADISELEIQILLNYAISSDGAVRSAALHAIDTDLDLGNHSYYEQIWLARHDEVSDNVAIATDIFNESGFSVPADSCASLVEALKSPDASLRGAAARALGASVALHKDQFEDVVKTLEREYTECIFVPSQPSNARGLTRRPAELVDRWETRSGIALAFKELAPVFVPSKLPDFFRFLINGGGFQDSNTAVREQLVAAGAAIITHQGSSQIEPLFEIFEAGLSGESKSESQDLLREAVVIMYGTLAAHLPAGDERIPGVTKRLIGTLDTPSETVQEAIADCLPSLVRAFPSAVADYMVTLEDDLLRSKKYGSQRGAAYGLAGVVRGRGIVAIREYQILEMLAGATANRKEARERQGAFLAYELLPTVLGRVFEPYVIEIVPQLLAGFGDTSTDVRAACLDAAKAAFAILSSYGVRTILPTLLSGLDDTQWRSKKGACELLGAMAFLDPRQLAERLPEIIPPLTDVLADSHKEVRAAANRSLARFGDVLRNPEIHAVVDSLLAALSDPTRHTEQALDKLIRVQFVHYLDSPSLAVVVRVLERGLSDRSSTKQKSAQIIASLAHLADKADLLGHLPVLVSGLRASAVDPVPATRATASKALGTLVEKLGEDVLPDLIPSLMEVLRSDAPTGDRLGSAQALSEVLAGLGTTRLEETLPTILQGVRSANFAVREGFMSLFVFLPACFGSSFANYLGRLIPPILAGLADEVETIRETALRAARLLVKNFAARAVDLFLPELERGLSDDNYRIRLSSAELVGDLLLNLTGLSKVDDNGEEAGDEEEEDVPSSTDAGNTLLSVLGPERRNRIFAALYVCRSDTAPLVRTTAINIWKTVVSSPRLLRELVPAVSRLVVRRLSSPSSEQQIIAAAALGELVRKAGDTVLASLLPTFESGLTSPDADSRRGICLGLRELLFAVSSEDIAAYDTAVFDLIRIGLVDTDADVRASAAEAFDALQELVGKRAVERVLPDLLSRLHSDDGQNALRGLLTLLTDTDRAAVIVPNVLAPLMAPPMTRFNAHALAAFATAAAPVLVRRLPKIVDNLVDAIVDADSDEELQEALRSSLDDIVISMADSESLDATLNILLQLSKHDDPRRRAEAARRFTTFFGRAQIDYSRYDSDLLHALLGRLDDTNHDVVVAASGALGAFTASLSKPRMESLVIPARDALGLVGTPGTVMPGFALPRGPGVVLPIFVHGLTTGSAEQRAAAALALSDLISRSDDTGLKPFTIQLTGALIRVVSDRSADVRAAVLLTLLNLLQAAPALLKSFLPQLQRAFAKSLTDPASDLIRSRAADALGTLIKLTPRVDPLVTELVTAFKAATDNSVKATLFKALYDVVKSAGSNLSPTSRTAVAGLVMSSPAADESAPPVSLLVRHAALVAVLLPTLTDGESAKLIRAHVLEAASPLAAMLMINSLLIECPDVFSDTTFGHQARELVVSGISASTNEALCIHSLMAAGKMLLSDSIPRSAETVEPVLVALSSAISTQNIASIRRLALVVLRAVGLADNALVAPQLETVVPVVYEAVRDRNMQVKLTAETAFVSVLDVVASGSARFDEYIEANGESLGPATKRSMTEYFRRVATRLASQERERQDAEGGQGSLGLSSQPEDLTEIWQPFASGLFVVV